jgi:hypothetical protein
MFNGVGASPANPSAAVPLSNSSLSLSLSILFVEYNFPNVIV